MKSDNLIDLIGYPISHVRIESFLSFLGISRIPPVDSFGWVFLENAEKGIKATFEIKNQYVEQFGIIKSPVNEQEDILILKEIIFDYTDKHISPLPFLLEINDNLEKIRKKLGGPKERSRTYLGGFTWKFIIQGFTVVIYISAKEKIQKIKIQNISIKTNKAIHIHKQLKLHNKFIQEENSKLILKLINDAPHKKWYRKWQKKNLKNHEKIFNNCKNIFIEFVENCSDATEDKNAVKIYNSTKKLIKQLNRLNLKNKQFIQHFENNDIVSFINSVFENSGFDLLDGKDIINEWSEW